jgi:hypothetical protein
MGVDNLARHSPEMVVESRNGSVKFGKSQLDSRRKGRVTLSSPELSQTKGRVTIENPKPTE